MPRFFLHVRTPYGLIEDEEGVEYPDYDKAMDEAVRGARCLMIGEVAEGSLCLHQAIEIHDAGGRHLKTVPFTEAVRLAAVPEATGEAGSGGVRL